MQRRTVPFQGRRPGHAGLLQTGSQLLQGPVPAQVPLGVGVVPLFDADVCAGLPPQVFGGLSQSRALSAQRGHLHPPLLRV